MASSSADMSVRYTTKIFHNVILVGIIKRGLEERTILPKRLVNLFHWQKSTQIISVVLYGSEVSLRRYLIGQALVNGPGKDFVIFRNITIMET